MIGLFLWFSYGLPMLYLSHVSTENFCLNEGFDKDSYTDGGRVYCTNSTMISDRSVKCDFWFYEVNCHWGVPRNVV